MQWTGLTGARRELLLATSLTIAVELAVGFSGRAGSAGQAAAALLVTVPLAVRLRFPLEVLAVVVAGVVLVAALGGLFGPSLSVVAVLLALYAVGSRPPARGLSSGLGCRSLGCTRRSATPMRILRAASWCLRS
jgi:hypothetical protein